jgi:hypothetical protein
MHNVAGKRASALGKLLQEPVRQVLASQEPTVVVQGLQKSNGHQERHAESALSKGSAWVRNGTKIEPVGAFEFVLPVSKRRRSVQLFGDAGETHEILPDEEQAFRVFLKEVQSERSGEPRDVRWQLERIRIDRQHFKQFGKSAKEKLVVRLLQLFMRIFCTSLFPKNLNTYPKVNVPIFWLNRKVFPGAVR